MSTETKSPAMQADTPETRIADFRSDPMMGEYIKAAQRLIYVQDSLKIASALRDQDRLYAAVPETVWISVDKELPTPDTRVLMLYAFPNGRQIEIGSYDCQDADFPELMGVWWGDQHILGANDISHWRPLPAPPSTTDAGKETA